MPMLDVLRSYWSAAELATNGVILLNLMGALLLGLLVGYERSYHGRAAGMRTYGLVCMASAALTVISGYPEFWFGGNGSALAGTDPTRIIQGIVTGIGFLGAGVIMREGFNISGLNTAASIWASSVIGILVGVGMYPSAMGLALLCALSMICLTYTASARLSENRFETYSSTSMFLLFDWPELYAAGLNCQGANPENALAAQSIQDKHRSRAPGSS